MVRLSAFPKLQCPNSWASLREKVTLNIRKLQFQNTFAHVSHYQCLHNAVDTPLCPITVLGTSEGPDQTDQADLDLRCSGMARGHILARYGSTIGKFFSSFSIQGDSFCDFLFALLRKKMIYSRLSLSRTRLSQITVYLEEKIWSLF